MSCNSTKPNSLSQRDKELVSLGAAIASNCIPCIEYHIPQARKAGLTDKEIHLAVALAEKVKRTPADKVLHTAHALLERDSGDVRLDYETAKEDDNHAKPCGCDAA